MRKDKRRLNGFVYMNIALVSSMGNPNWCTFVNNGQNSSLEKSAILSNEKMKITTVPIKSQDSVVFGYRDIVKTLFQKRRLPGVKKGLYGETLTQKNVTLEHVVPRKARNGASNSTNYALASRKENEARGDKFLASVVSTPTVFRYLKQFKGIKVFEGNGKTVFNGDEYIRKLIPQLKREGIDFNLFYLIMLYL